MNFEANTFYLFTARAYLDPNANQTEVRLYTQGLDDVTYVMSPSGAGLGYAAIPKGVWVEVFLVFQTGTDINGWQFTVWAHR
jgi:hypothetical protein